MKKYTFLVFHREYEHFLEQLREVGVVHISEKAEGILDDPSLEEKIQLSKQIEAAISKANEYNVEGALHSEVASTDSVECLMAELDKLIADKQQIQSAIAEQEKLQKQVAVWGDYSSAQIKEIEKAGYCLRYFTCPKSNFDESWQALYNAFIAYEDKSQVYFTTVSRSNETFDIEAEEIHLPEHNAAQIGKDIEALNGLLAAQQAKLESWTIQHYSDLQKALKDSYAAIDWSTVHLNTSSVADNKLKLLEGFCPIDNCPALDKMLDEEKIYYTEADPTEEDNAPVKLRNNKFTKMFEVLTGMYGWPVYGEFDPTPILAPFFLLFFAMCMGDAGYGILLILFGILTSKKVLKISMFEGLGPIITTLGVGTTIIGFFLGTFFGIDLYTASWVPDALKKVMVKGEVMGYDIQMVLALCIGVFHICLAMVVKAICYTKRFGFRQNVATWGWLLLILGGLITAVLALTKVFSPNVTKWVLIVIGAISALGIYVFNTPGRNPLINIGAGLWDTYNMATGILGDVLSYIRLYALGLAGGMLGGAFNNLATMVLGTTPNVGTWIGFIVILLIGHLLNLCMSALGAFVHPLRLSFVEYFKNSGYEGKGHLYKPFAN